MITVTRLNGKQFVLNAELIETMDETPDTVITLTGGNKYIVKEKVSDLVNLIVTYRKRCFTPLHKGAR